MFIIFKFKFSLDDRLSCVFCFFFCFLHYHLLMSYMLFGLNAGNSFTFLIFSLGSDLSSSWFEVSSLVSISSPIPTSPIFCFYVDYRAIHIKNYIISILKAIHINYIKTIEILESHWLLGLFVCCICFQLALLEFMYVYCNFFSHIYKGLMFWHKYFHL